MAIIQLSRKAFFHNLDIIAQQTSSVDKIALVLKDNAYGHGIIEIASLAKAYGITKAVVRTDAEADLIRDFFSYTLVLADTPNKAVDSAIYTVNSLEAIKKFPKNTKVALKFDTGMHRNGICFKQMEEAIRLAQEHSLIIEDIFTHFRSADTLSSEWFWQKKNFEMAKKSAVGLAEKYSIQRPRFHSCNSAALFRNQNFDEDI
ncbi:MAG TPA: alanine racemase, partial [Helicobacteraceae bacterium]|nr:alanine racemase [Helicobacteraceae bacterium]